MTLTIPSASTRVLSPDERARRTFDLLHRRDGSADAGERADLADAAVVLNVRVAHAVAGRYRNRGVPIEDLQQAACEGLVKAVARFDVHRQKDLLTFAVPTIRGEVLRYFRDSAWTVRPPRRLQDLQRLINQTSGRLMSGLGREPTPLEVQEALDISAADYAAALVAFGALAPISLDAPVTDDATFTRGDALADPTDRHQQADLRMTVLLNLRLLTERERSIVYLRYFEDRTQREIGEEFGVNQTQVSRWLTAIHAQLRTAMADLGDLGDAA